jgi:ABC-2 type transport system permease protein
MSVKELYIAFTTIFFREVKRFFRIWTQTLLPPVITMVLYFVIFGHLVGSRIGTLDGFSYMQYIVPGLIMMSVITNSYSNVASSLYGHRFQHSIEEVLVSPTPNWVILAGFVLGGAARGLITGLVVTLVSLFFTRLDPYNITVTLLVIVLAALLFATGGFINALYAKRFDDVALVPTFVITPLTYLGGVFFSISLLPEFWQDVIKINPILYMVNGFRYGILGISDVHLAFSISMILIFCLALAAFALYLLYRGKGLRT